MRVEDVLERIDKLLTVLYKISRDLTEISKTLMAVKAPTVIPVGKEEGLMEFRRLFPEDLERMLTFEETDDYVVIKPRQYLGSETFAKIASIIRDEGGEYVSAGRESHFRILKKNLSSKEKEV